MKQTALLLTLATTLFLGACGESKLPIATGKASIRALNGIAGSPEINFLIEERSIGALNYRSSSLVAEYDDLEYTFNFDVFFAGNTELTRIVSQHIDFVAGQEYTLFLSGSLAAPSLTLWESTEREFVTGATVFQARFAQTSNFFVTPVDFYLAPAGVAPLSGAEVATLSYGEIATARDFESGTYVLTITTAGDPADILFMSDETVFIAQSDVIISPFDATANDLSNFTVHVFGALGGSSRLIDSSIPASVEFLHAAMNLGTSDIYDDETLLSQVLANHAFTDLSGEISIPAGDHTFRYVPAGGTVAVTLEGDLPAVSGTRYRFIAVGEDTAYQALLTVPDRQPIDTAAKVSFYQSSNNFEFLNFYLVDQGEPIDGAVPVRLAFPAMFSTTPANIAPGNYDAYVTNFGETAILAGPVSVDIALGDVVELLAFDTASPTALELRLIASP